MGALLPTPYKEYPTKILSMPFLFGITFVQLGLNVCATPFLILAGKRSLSSLFKEFWSVFMGSLKVSIALFPFKSAEGPATAESVLRGVPPAVLNVPKTERTDFFIMRATAFLTSHAKGWFSALWNALILGRYRTTKPISDLEMGETWSSGIWATYLQSPQGGLEGLRSRWKDLTEAEFNEITSGFTDPNGFLPLELDPPFDGMSEWHYFDGMHGASTWGLFKLPRSLDVKPASNTDIDSALHGDWKKLQPAFIRLRTTPCPGGNARDPFDSTILVRPTDKAWGAAKLFLTHGAVHYLVLSRHPIIHFPMDTVNATTKNTLPIDHPLRSLLQPHQRYSLPLNSLVLYGGMLSILVNRWLDFAPFDIEVQDIWELVRDAYDPSTRADSFKTKSEVMVASPEPGPSTTSDLLERHGYNFSKAVPDANDPRNYSRFIYRYYEVIREYVSEVVDADSSIFREESVKEWGNKIAKILGPSSNFPNGTQLQDLEVLKTAVARVITDVSVMHSVDHIWYYQGPKWQFSPWRVRVPAPKNVNEDIDWNKVNTRLDAFRMAVTMPTIFWTGAASSLGDSYYSWSTPNTQQLDELAKTFRAKLAALDQSFTPYERITELKLIAPSIDY